MSKKQHIVVDLPHLVPTVALPRHVARTLQLIINSGSLGINTLELLEAGCVNPTRAISVVIKRGAIIGKEQKEAVDSLGEIHTRIAHYTYLGWHAEALIQPNEDEVAEDYL